MDFYRIRERALKNGVTEIWPDFQVGRSSDLMVRGKSFYAIWDAKKGLWSTDEYDLCRLVDEELREYSETREKQLDGRVLVRLMSDFSSKSWMTYQSWVKNVADNSHQLDSELTFANSESRKERYASRSLSYSLEEGDYSAWDELVGTLYDEDNRAKIEWAIGSVVAGDSRYIQKFLVFYGEAGAGKSTIMNVMQSLFRGYYTAFEAKALTSSNNAFATEAFKDNPLLAIQHDGDLSKIEDNAKLNSIVSHEEMTMNEKYKPSYMARANALLVMGTNRPVKITDAKSGIIRRLIDIQPSGKRLDPKHYQAVMGTIESQLGAISHHCLGVYQSMGRNYYNDYRPVSMQLQTDVFFNFVEDSYETFKQQDGTTLKQAYAMYKEFCDDALVEYKLAKHKFREELKNYFEEYHDRSQIGGDRQRSIYTGFKSEKFELHKAEPEPEKPYVLVIEDEESLIDDLYSDCPAQLANENETPRSRWEFVETKLRDIETHKIHYVKPPAGHIVIDFDLKDSDGNKSVDLNLEAASKWPPTYAEFSKGGGGIHLHYIYDGDPTRLKLEYSPGIEIKTFTGNASLRRRLTLCNNTSIARISDGLPMKEQKMINTARIKTEKSLRDLVIRNLKKEIHPGTKPSVDFIKKILDDAYNDGLEYDLTDMRPTILKFASQSTNQSELCVRMVGEMRFKSEDKEESLGFPTGDIVFFDTEIFPNLFLLNWKVKGSEKIHRMINPSPEEIEALVEMRLVGFNNRKYDNHILYARHLGYDNAQLYELSKRLVENSLNAGFADAYNLSYADVYDFCAKKQSLKKWEIELGLPHKELGLPWDEPVDTKLWPQVSEYCDNDVLATEAVFNNRHADFLAREALAKLSGLTVNDTTNAHTKRIIFGANSRPQSTHVYTDLSETFPGYRFEAGKSTYRGEETGEGGYVYAEPGVYRDVALLDVASMHPASIEALNLFGPYTEKFSNIKSARLAVKHGDLEKASKLLNTDISPNEDLDSLSFALKIAINSVYGLTAAKFDNAFKDPRNVDNIVAKRGALFMVDLKHYVQEQGFTVVHIKTDSIKIANATSDIIDKVFEFGKKYGYEFEHEATYQKICLVNDAVYIAKDENGWHATGAQFQHPVVYKTLFSEEQVNTEDYCETKAVTTALYLDMNEDLPEDAHEYKFVGKVGRFMPVQPGEGGGILLREKEGKYYSAPGSKGYRWLEATDIVKSTKRVDFQYSNKLVRDAVKAIEQYEPLFDFVDLDPSSDIGRHIDNIMKG